MPSGIYTRTKEGREKMSLAKKDFIPWNKGKRYHFSKEAIKKIKLCRPKGQKHYKWIEDRSLIKHLDKRNNPEYKQWKNKVWLRDNNTCKIANPDCSGRIEVHHILGWKDYPELRYQLNNGITLCHAHHPRKRAEEKRLSPYFQELVSVSNE